MTIAAFATSFFGRTSTRMLGLDFTSSWIQLVELRQFKSGRLELQACAMEPLKPGWFQDGTIANYEETVAALNRLLTKNSIVTKAVAMALPDTVVISKKVSLPAALTDTEIALQVEFEADRHIPFERSDISLDYCVLGPCADDLDRIDVWLVAARQERVQDMQGLAEAAGLQLHVLDVTSHAAHRAAAWALRQTPDGDKLFVALVELGSSRSYLQIIQGEQVIYSRDQNFGLSDFSLLLAQHYALSVEQADDMLQNKVLPVGYEEHVLLAYVEKLALEINRSLGAFYSNNKHQRVDLVMLSGHSMVLPVLSRVASGRLGIPCQVVNPFAGMFGKVTLPLVQSHASSFLRACGLAMRSLPR